jgi:hypothetical protein
MIFETLDRVASRKVPYLTEMGKVKSVLEQTLTANSQYIAAIRAYQQLREVVGSLDPQLEEIDEVIKRSDGLVSSRWSSLCVVHLQGWLDSHYMNTDVSHRAWRDLDPDKSVRGFAFMLNHPDYFYHILLLDHGRSREGFDRLSTDDKQRFAGAFGHFFGAEVDSRLPSLPPLYNAVVSEPFLGHYTVESLAAGPFRMHPIWSGMPYVRRLKDPRPAAQRIGNVADI